MTNWDTFSEQLAEWKEHPVTEVLMAASRVMQERGKSMILDSYWHGKAYDDADRRALIRAGEMFEDFFDSSAEELRAVMENENGGKPE